ncbi:MAG: HAMP domain-containing histidine kinase [Oscillospiraceae bacterium]|nr:HAMP domain-containing histidine kinase [Oscillospiraceae bacterium]
MLDKQIEELFHLQRDATLGVADGEIAFLNAACSAYYPALRPGMAAVEFLPPAVLEAGEARFVASVTLGDLPTTVIGSQMGEMQVFTLIPATLPGEGESQLLENTISSMRQNLTVLNMATELIAPAIHQLHEPKQQENLTALNRTYYHLQRLCDHLDNLFRLKEGRSRLHLEDVDMVSFCGDLIQSVDHFVKKLGTKLRFKSERGQLIAAIDKQKMTKLILGLLSNSLRRISAGGSVHLTLSGQGDDVILALRDTGPGIPPSTMSHVFAAYQQPQSDTDPAAGVGLGMALAQEIARLHGGTLLLTSEEGVGTTVRLRLPSRPADADGLLLETPLAYGEGDGGMHMILTELVDVLDDGAFAPRYLD